MKTFLQKTFLLVSFLLLVSLGFGQIPSGYYNNAVGKTGETLRAALRDIITSGHTKLSYTAVWNAYAYTDVTTPGGTTIFDMYSRKCDGTANYYFTLSTSQCGTSGAEGDCYSREHCLPNSCWGGLDNAANPQYTDLHHLFPCDQYVNVQKSNNMIGETTAPTYTSSNGSKTGPCSYPGYTDKVFEPLNCYKGDFARAWLYLATRYMNTMPSWSPSSGSAAMWPLIYNSTTNKYQPWVINMFLDWCTLDPVDQKEIDRNNAIYYSSGQHNRNPYVDHPEYVCLVWGTSCVIAPTITSVVTSPATSVTYPVTPAAHDSVYVLASITDDGSISSAILYWDDTPGTFSNSISMSLVSGSTYKTSDTIPRQPKGTTIYYKIVATDNQAHSTTSDIYTYCIPQDEPSNHPIAFSCGTSTGHSITVTWTDATGTILPNGYLINASPYNFDSIKNPSDGTPVDDGIFAKNVLQGVQTCTFSGLASNTTYYFKIFSYSNPGLYINYKLNGTIQSTSCTTLAGSGATATCLAEGFIGGTTAPSGWTFTGIGGTYTTSGNYYPTSPSLKLDATGDVILTPTVANPVSLSFWLKGQSTNDTSYLLVEGFDGATWSTIEQIGNFPTTGTKIPTTGTIKTYNSSSTPSLPFGLTQIKFTYNKYSHLGGNVSFDSVTVVCEVECSPVTQASAMTFGSVASTSMAVGWTRGSGTNVLVLAKAGSAVNADPVSGTPYADSDVFGSGEVIGTGNYVVYNGPASSVLVSGLTASTTYHYAVYEYNNTTDYCYKIPGLTGNQATNIPIPVLTTTAVTSITSSSASSGGDITDDGGSTVTARGVCWNTTGSPTIANSKTTDGTGIGTFTSSITGLAGGTTYYVRAYATNANGTAYGNEEIIATLRDEPSNHPTAFACGTTTTTTIPLTWNGATGSVLPHAYLIKASAINFGSISDPVDGVPETDGALVKNVTYGTNTYTFTGLNSNTTYYYKIYSYTNSGTAINYKTNGTIQSTNCTTVAVPTTIAYQGFESAPADTWNYSGGNANSSSYKWVGTYSRQLTTANPTATFSNISLASCSNVNLSVAFAAVSVPKNNYLYLDISYDNGSTWTGTGYTTLVNCNQSTGSKTVAFGATSSSSPTTVSTNPWVVSIPGSATQIAIRLRSTLTSGSFYIDDIKLTGIQTCTYPTAYNITGGGSFCSGGTGVTVGLDGSQTGVNYQFMSGVTAIGSPVAGTGSALSFGLQTTGGTYYVSATNTTTNCSTNMNGTATVTVNPSLPASVSISADPGTTVCPSTSVTFTATPTNGGTSPTYQWKKNGSNIGGATNSTYTDTPVNGDYYTCVITSNLACVTGSPATSNMLTMSVTTFPASVSIGASPSGAICAGTNVTFTATPTNGGTPSYQWKVNGGNVGTNSSTYTSSALANGDNVTCVMTSGLSCATGSPATSNSVAMTVNSTNAVTVSIVASPSNSITSGDQVVFTATPTNGGTTPTYQWKKNGVDVSGETGTTYTTTTLANGDVITCVLTSNISCPSGSPATSNSITMTVASTCTGGTTTVFSDDFSTNNSATWTTSGAIGSSAWSVNVSGVDWGSRRNTSPAQLELTNDASATANVAGWTYASTALGSFSSPYNATLSSNPGIVTWTFNMRTNRTSALAGFSTTSSYGLAFVLSSTSNTPNTTGTGYAVVMGGGGTNTIALIKFNNGLQGTKTTVIAYAGAPAALTNYMSVKLTYDPSTNSWQLFNRDDGNTAFADPTSGTLTSLGSATDNTYTGTAMTYLGCYWQGSTTANQISFIDNVKATVASGSAQPPTSYTVSGGGTLCSGGSGVTVNLSGSESGVNYQLKVNGVNTGSPVAGTGSAISFTNQTTAGTYTVQATNTSTTCTATMTGSATVTVNPFPTAYSVTGGGSYCSGGTGVAVGLGNSESGVNYQLKVDGGNIGSPVAGTGSAIDFGNQTSAGTYTVVATNATTSCTNNMSGSVNVSINPLPTAYNVTGGGVYCSGGSGVAVGLDGSQSGTLYQLKLDGVDSGSPVAGTGSAINFGYKTSAGTYTVVATIEATSCSASMTGNAIVSINSLPTTYSVSGGGSFCNGGSGVTVGLSNSQSGVNYQLQLNSSPWGSPVAGTGSSISFGTFTIAGTYTVVATNATTGCVNTMNGSVTVTVNPLPTLYSVTGGGSYCAGGSGLAVGLSNSESGVNYQLKRDGLNTGSPVAGTGSAMSFGNQTAAGTYTVSASNATTSCVNNMTGNVTVTINALPAAYSVTGGGTYCSGGSGVAVGLSNSESGVNYQLQIGAVNTGSPVAGTGFAISFGLQTSAGTYTVVATNSSTLCSSSMSGNVAVIINTVTPVASVSNTPGCGIGEITVTSDQSGLQTFELCDNVGAVLQTWSGNATSHVFSGLVDGTYTGKVTYGGCVSVLSSTTTLTNILQPIASIVPNPGCGSGNGSVTISSNQTATQTFDLCNSSGGVLQTWTGNAASHNFSSLANGTYYGRITLSSCASALTSGAVLASYSLPSVYAVSGGGAYCSGGVGVPVSLSNSQVGIEYWIRIDGVSAGSPIAGTGSALDFGNQTTAGTYTIRARNTTTLCENNMSGSVIVTVNPLLPVSMSISADPGTTITSGTSVTFTATPTNGGTPTYQWKLNGGNVGTNSSTYITSTLVDGDKVTCVMTSSLSCCSGNPATSNELTMTVTSGDKTVNLTVILQSLFNGTDMYTKLDESLSPLYGAGIAEKITVELHAASSPWALVTSASNVDLATDGSASFTVSSSYSASYYIVVISDNHVETWSTSAVSFAGGTITYNYTSSASQAYSDNEVEVATGVYAIFGGDANSDGLLDGSDMADVDYNANNFIWSAKTDINGDGIVDGSDMGLVENNSNNFICALKPGSKKKKVSNIINLK